MSYVSVVGPCIRCGRMFQYSPTKVPSVNVNGSREPLCETCMTWINEKRKEAGIPVIPIMPGAYEADDEEEFIYGGD